MLCCVRARDASAAAGLSLQARGHGNHVGRATRGAVGAGAARVLFVRGVHKAKKRALQGAQARPRSSYATDALASAAPASSPCARSTAASSRADLGLDGVLCAEAVKRIRD